MNVALYPALLCPAWEASPRKGLWDCWHPRGAKAELLAAPSRHREASRAPVGQQAGSMGSPAQCLWDGVKWIAPCLALSIQAHCALKRKVCIFLLTKTVRRSPHGPGWLTVS